MKQVVSKTIAANPHCAKTIFSKAVYFQFTMAICMAIVVFGLSSILAEFFKDPKLTSPLKYMSMVIVFQSLVFIIIGTFNGLKNFFAQNLVFGTYSIIRPIAVVVLVWLGFGVQGAVFGFVIASAVALIIGFILVGDLPNQDINLSAKDILMPAIGNIIIFGSLALLLNIDLLFVKRLLADNTSAGLYTAAAVFSKVPYRFVTAFGIIALPLVASSFAQRDFPQCKVYLSQVVRYSTIIFLPLIIIFSATSKELIVYFYNPEYELAGPPLSLLVFGIWFVGLVNIVSHIMIAIDEEQFMLIVSIAAALLAGILSFIFVPIHGLLGAALATSTSAFLLLLISGGYLIKRIGLDITPISVFRITLLSIVVYNIPQNNLFQTIPLLAKLFLLYIGFAFGLIITREIGPEDWIVIKRLIQPRSQT